jgi:L-fucose mutarotase/ribose pyranase (RbsD/FucU family)
LYIIEDDTSPEVLKTIMVLGHKECIALEDTEQLEFIGTFINGDNIDLFVVFELK